MCQVSPSTASRFFSGKPVSKEIYARLKKMCRETGYEPPPGYHSRRKTSNAIITLLPDFQHAYFTDMIRQLAVCAARIGKQLVVIPTQEDASGCLRTIDELHPAGIILLDEQSDDPVADRLEKRGLPVTVCGSRALSRRFPSVRIDDFLAAYEGMNYLISLKHRQILILSDTMEAVSSGFQRTAGCRKAAMDAGLELGEDMILPVGTTFDAGYEGMGVFLSRSLTFTAVFAFSDDMAAGAIARLNDEGLRVPEDVSVLGFDDNSIASHIRPRLTTVHQPISQIAEHTMGRLLSIERPGDISTLTLPCHVLERDSCRGL